MSGREITNAELLLESAKSIVNDNLTENFVQFAIVSEQLGVKASAEILRDFDEVCPMPDRGSAYHALVQHLVLPHPIDLERFSNDEIREMSGGWGLWCDVEHVCEYMGALIENHLHSVTPLQSAGRKIEAWFEAKLSGIRKSDREIER